MNCELTNMVLVEDPETGKVLVQKRVKKYCGIAFPGGHVEDGESIYDSAVREIFEETGLTVKSLTPCGFMYWYNDVTEDRYFTYFYKATQFTGELIACTEEGPVFWVDREEMKNLRLSPNMERYLPMFDGKYAEAYCAWHEGSEQKIIYR